jgi:hypothetical protein
MDGGMDVYVLSKRSACVRVRKQGTSKVVALPPLLSKDESHERLRAEIAVGTMLPLLLLQPNIVMQVR